MPARTLGLEEGWIRGFHIDWRREQVSARTLSPERGWIVRSHIGWGGEQSIPYKGVEPSPSQTRFKNLEGKLKKERPKRTVSISGGLGLLQIVLEPDTG